MGKDEKPMTPDWICEQIKWLKDDVQSCERIIRSPEASFAEKSECRQRALSNRREIVHLESTLLMLNSDNMFIRRK